MRRRGAAAEAAAAAGGDGDAAATARAPAAAKSADVVHTFAVLSLFPLTVAAFAFIKPLYYRLWHLVMTGEPRWTMWGVADHQYTPEPELDVHAFLSVGFQYAALAMTLAIVFGYRRAHRRFAYVALALFAGHIVSNVFMFKMLYDKYFEINPPLPIVIAVLTAQEVLRMALALRAARARDWAHKAQMMFWLCNMVYGPPMSRCHNMLLEAAFGTDKIHRLYTTLSGSGALPPGMTYVTFVLSLGPPVTFVVGGLFTLAAVRIVEWRHGRGAVAISRHCYYLDVALAAVGFLTNLNHPWCTWGTPWATLALMP